MKTEHLVICSLTLIVVVGMVLGSCSQKEPVRERQDCQERYVDDDIDLHFGGTPKRTKDYKSKGYSPRLPIRKVKQTTSRTVLK